ncbi:DNA-deoxyinosine glycosylase [Xanthomonas sp. XNM01]|uniref:DNA-deoxyinosine glycosylase n=1 Tax=Xanthomonas sp. XNM01 TaxID=2769289 RepID=UPI001786C149|nr:DNA-deoxyinosine glycosylase [Xanthomonas sp. XNM01]MBD9370169.1 DNA-deoxyinosine glycosylase [Xanthomonas sp. XNM01]
MDDATLQGLPPHIADDCRVLVLGSMPGAASLAAGRYYAHPRNRFWPLFGRLCGVDPALEYPARLAALQAAGVGLWDVIGRCARAGSLDSAIRDAQVNPLTQQLRRLPALRAIAFNGAKAAAEFERGARRDPALAAAADGKMLLGLPSTSPANAAFDAERLFDAWSVLRAHLQR